MMMNVALILLSMTTAWLFFSRKALKKSKYEMGSQYKVLEEKIRKLEESGEQLNSIIAHMNEAVVAVYSDFRIAYFNKAFQNIFSPDYDLQDGLFFTDVVRNTQLNEFVQSALHVKKTQKMVMEFSVGGEVGKQWASSQRRTSEVQSIYIPLKNKELIALVFYDLTDIKEAEKMKRDFITNASHQLKTPLTAIQGYAETLIEDADMSVNIRNDFIRKIEIKSVEASDLVSKLLRLSKLESKVESVEIVKVRVEKLVEDIEKKFEGIVKKHQVHLIHKVENDQIEIQTDPSLFQLIVENLLENAIKYSKPNGNVFLAVRQNSQGVELEIKDEGIGIPEQDQSRIFERFFRSHNAENHTHDGIGIGMAMVKSALEKIQGSIEVTSSQHKGTTMKLTFPMEVQ